MSNNKKEPKVQGFNIKAFINGSNEHKDLSLKTDMVVVNETKPAGPISKKSESKNNALPAVAAVPQTSMSYIQENIPYATAYQETTKQLDEAIDQLNAIGNETMYDLQAVRSSKTLRNKYNYITDLTQTVSGIIDSKITAIKEKNKTINDINHMELERMKQLKNQVNEEDDNARIANLYNAFVNTPVGGGVSVLGPSMQDMMTVPQSGVQPLPVMQLGGDQYNDQSSWEAGLNPAENRMLLEAKGQIETVVMYDETSGNRWYEVLDKNTRQPVPNVEKPSNDTIYDLDLNIRGGFAKDSNRNVTYPLIVVNNGDTSITQF